MGLPIKLILQFGFPSGRRREVTWNKDLKDFPKIVSFQGKKWEWISYDRPAGMIADYELVFGSVSQDIDLGELPVPNIDEMFPDYSWGGKCECGAIHQKGFENFHSYWCPKWVKI